MSEADIRPARAGDEGSIVTLLRELAVYERLENRFQLTPEMIARDFFCEPPAVRCELAFVGTHQAGIMTWYSTYSSFTGTRGIHLEDFYVRPGMRRRGIGRALLGRLAKHALEIRAARIEWAVLKWNQPAIAFYESVHAERVDDWHVFRLVGKTLANLAVI